MMNTELARLQKGLISGYPLFYLVGQEERRIESMLTELARRHFGDGQALVSWSVSRGFQGQAGMNDDVRDPVAALRRIADDGRKGFYLMRDMPALLAGNPTLVRSLRDLYRALAGKDIYVFLSHTDLLLPEELKKEMFLVRLGIPGEQELLDQMRRTAEAAGAGSLSEDFLFRCAAAMKGMSLDEAAHLTQRLVREGHLDLDNALPEILEEKSYALLKEGCLQYIGKTIHLDQVGGLENLKEWVVSRKPLFSRAAFEAGVPLPAGILFMGVSGCGKSMAAKVIAGAWNLPLVRLDMNLVLSGAYGAPEYAFDHALRVAEQIAPLVLWIDEMENSFGYDLAGGGGNNNIFASFLTWMQEKPADVFVVATANRIEKLPAEVIRKGRFDQLFFLDLPTDDERKAILRIQIKAYGGDPDTFNINLLTAATRNWSGAEIEQAVKAARIRAYQEQRPFNDQDVVWNTARMVPLSRTMEEQIKQLRLWSVNRATPASRKAEG